MDWRELASRIVDGEELHFVLVEGCYSDNGEPYTLFVDRNHLTPDRETIHCLYFNSADDAKRYCLDKYAIPREDWGPTRRFRHEFSFEYEVTDLGVAQPHEVGFDDARIYIKTGTVMGGDDSPFLSVNVCGNREGLRRLAAMLLLAADSEQYGDRYHVHLDDLECVNTDVIATIRAPSYLKDLEDGSFTEGSSKYRRPSRFPLVTLVRLSAEWLSRQIRLRKGGRMR